MDQLRVIRLEPEDSVAVALQPLERGCVISCEELSVTLREPIDTGHKVALHDIREAEPVLKYGHPIGIATHPIRAGEWVHTHNLRSDIGPSDSYRYHPSPFPRAATEPDTFEAFLREDGSVGIRNELWIIPTVGCVNRVAASLAKWASERCDDGSWGAIEGAYAWEHPFGCSQLGDDLEQTRSILASLARHPNAAGVLIVALGCENNTVDSFKECLGSYDTDRIRFLVCQETEDELAEGRRLLSSLARRGSAAKRSTVPISRLVVGLKCGGSDGLSGITANPLVGMFTDHLVRSGGSAILSEIPEMFGAERPLLDRCIDPAVFARLAEAIQSWKRYYIAHGQPVHENPSPGNQAGGITTLEEKSLGCVKKGGSGPVHDVIDYGKRIRRTGLTVCEAPGNDLVSSTALAAAGAHLILFTTGRGTPWGSAVPTVKIASNTTLATRKAAWIDFDAAKGLQSEPLVVFNTFRTLILAVASGTTRVKHEINGYREIALFKDGVTL